MAKKASLATAKAVPVFLTLIVAYVSYVIVGPLSVTYLINGPRPRIAAGIALPIVWFLILLPVAATYLRLLLVVILDPGYTELGEGGGGDEEIDEGSLRKQRQQQQQQHPPADFWMRDVFVCDPKGLPIWCPRCRNWKPDRAHHSRDAGRCTLKMDHFCPWVGGVVGERSVNFFLQFLVYATLLSAYATCTLAYFVHEDRGHVQWIVALGLAGFFLLFTLGMVGNSFYLVGQNRTTIENIEFKSRTMFLAVLLPPELQPSSTHQNGLSQVPGGASISPSRSDGAASDRPLTSERPLASEIDDPAHSSYFNNPSIARWPIRRASRSEFWRGTVTYPLEPSAGEPTRTFAILETPEGMNPWNLGSPWRNMTAVLGTKAHDWLLPLHRSPCCDHSSRISFYPLGPQFEDLLEDAGLIQAPQTVGSTGSALSSRSGRKKKRLPEGWRHGERPDGWISQKEARRAKRRQRERDMR